MAGGKRRKKNGSLILLPEAGGTEAEGSRRHGHASMRPGRGGVSSTRVAWSRVGASLGPGHGAVVWVSRGTCRSADVARHRRFSPPVLEGRQAGGPSRGSVGAVEVTRRLETLERESRAGGGTPKEAARGAKVPERGRRATKEAAQSRQRASGSRRKSKHGPENARGTSAGVAEGVAAAATWRAGGGERRGGALRGALAGKGRPAARDAARTLR